MSQKRWNWKVWTVAMFLSTFLCTRAMALPDVSQGEPRVSQDTPTVSQETLATSQDDQDMEWMADFDPMFQEDLVHPSQEVQDALKGILRTQVALLRHNAVEDADRKITVRRRLVVGPITIDVSIISHGGWLRTPEGRERFERSQKEEERIVWEIATPKAANLFLFVIEDGAVAAINFGLVESYCEEVCDQWPETAPFEYCCGWASKELPSEDVIAQQLRYAAKIPTLRVLGNRGSRLEKAVREQCNYGYKEYPHGWFRWTLSLNGTHLPLLAEVKNLEYLGLMANESQTSEVFTAEEVKPLAKLKKLEVLQLPTQDGACLEVFASLPQLRKLNILFPTHFIRPLSVTGDQLMALNRYEKLQDYSCRGYRLTEPCEKLVFSWSWGLGYNLPFYVGSQEELDILRKTLFVFRDCPKTSSIYCSVIPYIPAANQLERDSPPIETGAVLTLRFESIHLENLTIAYGLKSIQIGDDVSISRLNIASNLMFTGGSSFHATRQIISEIAAIPGLEYLRIGAFASREPGWFIPLQNHPTLREVSFKDEAARADVSNVP